MKYYHRHHEAVQAQFSGKAKLKVCWITISVMCAAVLTIADYIILR